MELITFAEIERDIDILRDLSQDAYDMMVEQFIAEQPHLTAYLLEVDENEFTEDMSDLILGVSVELWYMIKKKKGAVGLVSEESIDVADTDNAEQLAFLEDEDYEGQEESIAKLSEEHPQGDLLQFIYITICQEEGENDEDDDSDEIGEMIYEPEELSMMFVVIKSCLDTLMLA
jgi:hypothetical protein